MCVTYYATSLATADLQSSDMHHIR